MRSREAPMRLRDVPMKLREVPKRLRQVPVFKPLMTMTSLIYQDGGVFDSQPQNMSGTELETRWINILAWGLWRQDLPVTNCRLSNGQRLGIEELRIGRSLPQLLITLVTLGFWTPTTVSWRCCRPPIQSGILE